MLQCAGQSGRQETMPVSTLKAQMIHLALSTDFATFLITGQFCRKPKTEKT
jgi:hypothetical protein